MKAYATIVPTLLLAAARPGPAGAEWINGVYWADDVPAWTGAVQNYGGELMTEETTWWLTGSSDADVDGNGYAWDEGDNDYVAGWRSSGSASLTVYFHLAIPDIDGPDLIIHEYGGSSALASVWASPGDVDYVQVGTWGGGTPGWFEDVEIDFDGLLDSARYIRVVREASGPQTGTFIDSFAMVADWKTPRLSPDGQFVQPERVEPVGHTPEPTTAGMFLLGAAVLCCSRRLVSRRFPSPVGSPEAAAIVELP
jgi:hypothetical protein